MYLLGGIRSTVYLGGISVCVFCWCPEEHVHLRNLSVGGGFGGVVRGVGSFPSI